MIFKNLGKIRKIRKKRKKKIKINLKKYGRILRLKKLNHNNKDVIHYFIVIK